MASKEREVKESREDGKDGGSNLKRMQLSQDQRAVLEAVYAIEKLPDAALRDRLSSYLNLTSRQIQVWFQNRRQRAKAKDPPRTALSTSDQIMDALFEFSDSLPADARARMALNAICNKIPHSGGSEPSLGESKPEALMGARGDRRRSGEDAMPLCGELCNSSGGVQNGSGLPHNLSFDWGLPTASSAPFAQNGGMGLPQEEGGFGDGLTARHGFPPLAAVTPPSPPPPMVLEAMMGFMCHVLKLEAIDYSTVFHGSNGSVKPALLQSYAPEGTTVLNALAWARSMLSLPIIDAVASARQTTWFGGTCEQRDMLSRAGRGVQNLIGVACLESPGMWDNFGSATKPADGPVVGVLLLYSATPLDDTPQLRSLLSILGSAVSAAALGAPAIRPPAPDISYGLHPRHSRSSALGWLLLVAARVVHADIAEHWRAETSPAGVSMIAERLLVSTSVPATQAVLATGVGSENVHQFSSQMCRASLYAGKVVWCNATHPSGVLEGVSLPIKTAIGLPIASAGSAQADALVLYSLRRLEQCQLTTSLLLHLQLLLCSAVEVQAQLAPARTWTCPAPAPVAPMAPVAPKVSSLRRDLISASPAAAPPVGSTSLDSALGGRQKRALSFPSSLDVLGYEDEDDFGLPSFEPGPGASLDTSLACLSSSRLGLQPNPKRVEHGFLRSSFGTGDLGTSSPSLSNNPPSLGDFTGTPPRVHNLPSLPSVEDVGEEVAAWDQLSADQMLDLINRCLEEEDTTPSLSDVAGLDLVNSLELAAAPASGAVDSSLLKRTLSAQRLIEDPNADLSREQLVALRERLGGGPPPAPSSGMGLGACPVNPTQPGKCSVPSIPTRVRRPVLSGIPLQRSGCSEGLDSLEL